MKYATDFIEIQTCSDHQQQVPMQAKWQPPCSQAVKINFHGVSFKGLDYGGLGVLIRDSAGCVLSACCERMNFYGDPLRLSMEALLRALTFGREMGHQQFGVELAVIYLGW